MNFIHSHETPLRPQTLQGQSESLVSPFLDKRSTPCRVSHRRRSSLHVSHLPLSAQEDELLHHHTTVFGRNIFKIKMIHLIAFDLNKKQVALMATSRHPCSSNLHGILERTVVSSLPLSLEIFHLIFAICSSNGYLAKRLIKWRQIAILLPPSHQSVIQTEQERMMRALAMRVKIILSQVEESQTVLINNVLGSYAKGADELVTRFPADAR